MNQPAIYIIEANIGEENGTSKGIWLAAYTSVDRDYAERLLVELRKDGEVCRLVEFIDGLRKEIIK